MPAKRGALCLLLPLLLWAAPSGAVTIDFEDATVFPGLDLTDGAAYAHLGVLIAGAGGGDPSLLTAGPQSGGSAISGQYIGGVNSQLFASCLELVFPAGALDVRFDWATGVGSVIRVSSFDTEGGLLSSVDLRPTATFRVSATGGDLPAGLFGAPIGAPIGRIFIENRPVEGLFLDNLRFTPVPEPGSALLLLAGLAALAWRSLRSG